jgi:hypothetical protein
LSVASSRVENEQEEDKQAMDGQQQPHRAGVGVGANEEAGHPGGARGGSGGSNSNRRTLPSGSAGSKAHPRSPLGADGHDPDDPAADLEHDEEEEEEEDESGRMAAAGAAATSQGERLSEEAMEGRVHRRYVWKEALRPASTPPCASNTQHVSHR